MAISKEDIEHLEKLARIKVGEKESEKLAGDLGDILKYVDQLKEADVSGVSEMTHSVELKNIFRKDELAVRDVEADEYNIAKELINAFPEKQGDYLKVKAIL